MSAKSKFDDLLQRLIVATQDGKVSWEPGGFEDSYRTKLPRAAVEVGIDWDFDRKHLGYYAELMDDTAKVVERMTCSSKEREHPIRLLWDEAGTIRSEDEGDLLERLLADVHALMSERYQIRPTGSEPLDSKFKRLIDALAKAMTAAKIEWKETIVENVFELPLKSGTIRIAGDPLRRPDRPLYLSVLYPQSGRVIASLDPENTKDQDTLYDLFNRVRLETLSPRVERILDQVLAELK